MPRDRAVLLKLPDAALQLGISFPTIKQWIYKKKIRSLRTAGGHHRIPQGGMLSRRRKSASQLKFPNPQDRDTQQ